MNPPGTIAGVIEIWAEYIAVPVPAPTERTDRAVPLPGGTYILTVGCGYRPTVGSLVELNPPPSPGPFRMKLFCSAAATVPSSSTVQLTSYHPGGRDAIAIVVIATLAPGPVTDPSTCAGEPSTPRTCRNARRLRRSAGSICRGCVSVATPWKLTVCQAAKTGVASVTAVR